MKEIELVLKETTTKKLTITPTRISIKLPATTPKDEVENYKAISLAINEELNPTQSWRGSFGNHTIVMYTQNRNEKKSFKLIELC